MTTNTILNMTTTYKIQIPPSQVYEIDNVLYFRYNTEENKTIQDIPVNLMKASRACLNDLATHADIEGYRRIKKPELVRLLQAKINIQVPDEYRHLLAEQRDILDMFQSIQQVYIPKTQQTALDNPSGPKFWLDSDKNTLYSIYISTLTLKELKALSKGIGIRGYSTLRHHELVTLLEDKLVMQELA